MEKSTQRLSTTQYKQECEKVERIINRLESSDPDFDDCNDAVVLLRKYKKLCREIGRGDSYHLGRIDSAIQGLESPQPASTQPVAVPELRKVRRAEDGRPKANYDGGFDHGWNDCVYEMRAMLSAAQQPEGVAEPTEAMLEVIQQVRLIDWCCDKDGNPTTVSECSARAIAEAVIAAGQKGGAA